MIYWKHILRVITTDCTALAGGSYSLTVDGDLLATFGCWPVLIAQRPHTKAARCDPLTLLDMALIKLHVASWHEVALFISSRTTRSKTAGGLGSMSERERAHCQSVD